ncbi:MAG TPA: family 3 encapsulin nanocompartment shell protein [Kofleriaceae bacterium]|nr:family 3 encapsulin nanocompartment shell protein [Kofleriaceae bacterium]
MPSAPGSLSPAIPPSSGDPRSSSPGQLFASACAEQGKAARVELPATITEQFPGFARRPRIAMRSLFKIVKISEPAANYWFETHPSGAAGAVADQELRAEAGFEFRSGSVALSPITAWVQIPTPLLDDRDALASFIDFRLLVRLGTAENQALARGPGGLLAAPGIRRLPPGPDPVTSLLAACDHVELVGGSADGIVMNTTDYYRYLVPRADVVSSLAALGIRIARTRMVPAGTIIVGDFFAGTTIFDSGRSTIAFGQPPAGTFARDGIAVRAEIRTALAIHLPTHLFVASLVPGARGAPS